jgi:glycosyltransferase involved in cell wall biosynthesis
LPVVAGNTGGVATIVADGESGLLVAPGDADAFAAAVRTLLADPGRRAAMGEAARHLVLRRHDLPTAARSLDAAIRLLSAARRCA